MIRISNISCFRLCWKNEKLDWPECARTVKEYQKQSADNPGQNLLRQIAKMPVFSCHPGKNWNLRQMNARFSPSPYPKLFRIAWQLYTLAFRPRQLWIGGGEGVYILCLGETGVGRKSEKIHEIVSTVLSGTVAPYSC